MREAATGSGGGGGGATNVWGAATGSLGGRGGTLNVWGVATGGLGGRGGATVRVGGTTGGLDGGMYDTGLGDWDSESGPGFRGMRPPGDSSNGCESCPYSGDSGRGSVFCLGGLGSGLRPSGMDCERRGTDWDAGAPGKAGSGFFGSGRGRTPRGGNLLRFTEAPSGLQRRIKLEHR